MLKDLMPGSGWCTAMSWQIWPAL